MMKARRKSRFLNNFKSFYVGVMFKVFNIIYQTALSQTISRPPGKFQFQLWRLFQSTSCCYTNFTAIFKNILKMLWRQLAQGWTDELCWEQPLSLKSYSGTRTQLVAGGTIQRRY